MTATLYVWMPRRNGKAHARLFALALIVLHESTQGRGLSVQIGS